MQEKCKNKVNRCIECTVYECANHSAGEEYCTLEKIKVTTHENEPNACRCTDCASFVPVKKSNCCK